MVESTTWVFLVFSSVVGPPTFPLRGGGCRPLALTRRFSERRVRATFDRELSMADTPTTLRERLAQLDREHAQSRRRRTAEGERSVPHEDHPPSSLRVVLSLPRTTCRALIEIARREKTDPETLARDLLSRWASSKAVRERVER